MVNSLTVLLYIDMLLASIFFLFSFTFLTQLKLVCEKTGKDHNRKLRKERSKNMETFKNHQPICTIIIIIIILKSFRLDSFIHCLYSSKAMWWTQYVQRFSFSINMVVCVLVYVINMTEFGNTLNNTFLPWKLSWTVPWIKMNGQTWAKGSWILYKHSNKRIVWDKIG